MKLCGEVLPSRIKADSPMPSMTFAIKECKGFIVVTTFSSALVDDVPVNIIEKINILTSANILLFCFILVFIDIKLML